MWNHPSYVTTSAWQNGCMSISPHITSEESRHFQVLLTPIKKSVSCKAVQGTVTWLQLAGNLPYFKRYLPTAVLPSWSTWELCSDLQFPVQLRLVHTNQGPYISLMYTTQEKSGSPCRENLMATGLPAWRHQHSNCYTTLLASQLEDTTRQLLYNSVGKEPEKLSWPGCSCENYHNYCLILCTCTLTVEEALAGNHRPVPSQASAHLQQHNQSVPPMECTGGGGTMHIVFSGRQLHPLLWYPGVRMLLQAPSRDNFTFHHGQIKCTSCDHSLISSAPLWPQPHFKGIPCDHSLISRAPMATASFQVHFRDHSLISSASLWPLVEVSLLQPTQSDGLPPKHSTSQWLHGTPGTTDHNNIKTIKLLPSSKL